MSSDGDVGKTPDEGKDELFNLATDPYEKNECSGQNSGILTELKEELKRQYVLDK